MHLTDWYKFLWIATKTEVTRVDKKYVLLEEEIRIGLICIYYEKEFE